jgi:hypothetical protein
LPGENSAECGENDVRAIKEELNEERLHELSLDTLDERRHQADMVFVHKILHGKSQYDHTCWFEKVHQESNVGIRDFLVRIRIRTL